MRDQVEQLLREIDAFSDTDPGEIEAFRIRFLGKKGVVRELSSALKSLSLEEKKTFGKVLNELKNKVQSKIDLLSGSQDETATQASGVDLTRPAKAKELGSRHPISLVRDEIVEIFARMGFDVSDGPEIEDDWHNFGALNFPPDHPARDMQDTFFVEGENGLALRTHTSSVQVHVMENNTPPIRTLSPGRVFRNEAISARAHCIFHQIEGLYIDKDVSFADLK